MVLCPMSADPIRDSIVGTLSGFGYNVAAQTTPTNRSWDTLPIVRVCEQTRPIVSFMGMGAVGGIGKRSVSQTYQVAYVDKNQLSTLIPDAFITFKTNIINSFMGANSSLARVPGVWQSRVYDDSEFRRDLIGEGYNFSAMLIVVDLIQNP